MRKDAPRLTEGFSPENIARIYRGEAALVEGAAPREVLTPREIEALSYLAEGLTYEEMAREEKMGLAQSTIDQHIATGKRLLGITNRNQVAGYFPLGPEHDAVKGKKLGDFGRSSKPLEFLEAVSTGLSIGQAAQAHCIEVSTAYVHIFNTKQIWSDVSKTLLLTGVVDAVRAKYVRAIEADPNAEDLLGGATLPELKEAEPDILEIIEAQKEGSRPTA